MYDINTIAKATITFKQVLYIADAMLFRVEMV